MSPDGSMQLLFLPTSHWWKPYPCNINAGYVNNTNWNPTGAWFIRSVFSPIQPMPCLNCHPQPCQEPNDISFHRTYSNSCLNVNQPSYTPPFELKFHNDICTSTSDIHYFYPNSRPCGFEWLPKKNECTSIQVDVPMVTSPPPCEDIRLKSCNCAPLQLNKAKKTCHCRKPSDASIRDMSCETDKSDEDCRQENKSRKKKSKPKKKKNIVICECTDPETTDKCVTTFTDKGTAVEKGCETQTANRNGRETQTAHAAACGKVHETQTACAQCHDTQTACGSIPVNMLNSRNVSARDIKAEIWVPKTPESKKVMQIKSYSFTGVCESGCCSGNCSCHSDTD